MPKNFLETFSRIFENAVKILTADWNKIFRSTLLSGQ